MQAAAAAVVADLVAKSQYQTATLLSDAMCRRRLHPWVADGRSR
jgi:hypothetical protein